MGDMELSVSRGNVEANAVCVRNLSKSYGKGNPVLENVSMSVKQGSVYGLLGSSGCGKSTLLCCILNLKEWDEGDVLIFGERVNKNNKIRGKSVGYMPQDLAMYDHLTVEEMMKYFSKLYGMIHKMFKERMTFMEDLIDLKGFRTRRIISLSGGQKRRVSMSLALLHNPKLLILDEPTVGLDPLLRERVWDYLFKLALNTKTTIVITTHYIEEVKCANKVGIMRKGRILIEEDPALLMRQRDTFILEEVVRDICFEDMSKQSKTNVAVTFNYKTRKTSSDPVSLRKFYRKVSTDKPVKEPALLDQEERTAPQLPTVISEQDMDMDTTSVWTDSILASITRSFEYSHITWINFIRNPIFIFLLILLPVIQTFSTGLVVGVIPKYTPVGLVNHEIPHWASVCPNNTLSGNYTECDTSTFSCAYISQLLRRDFIQPIQFLTTEDAHEAVLRGDTSGYIQIPSNFSQHLIERVLVFRFPTNETLDGTIIKLNMDLSESITMFFFMQSMYQVFFDFVGAVQTECEFDLKSLEQPLHYRRPVYGEKDASIGNEIIPPGVLGLLFEIAFAVTPLVLISDIKCGVLERSKTAGLRNIEWMTGLLITMVSVAVVQSFLIYLTLIYALNFYVPGARWIFVVFCLLACIIGGTLGLLIGVIFKDEMSVIIIAAFIMPVMMCTIGLMHPMEFLPEYYRPIVHHSFPIAALVDSYLFAMDRELGLFHAQVWPGLLISLGWSVAFSILALIVMRRF